MTKSDEDIIQTLEGSAVPWEIIGFDTHRGVVVAWDRDHDERILTLIDSIADQAPGELVFASEHEAEVVLAWRKDTPLPYARGRTVEVAGDAWSIRYSEAAL